MDKIYSKVAEKEGQKLLLHIINRVDDITTVRDNLIADNEFLQLSTMNLKEGQTFKPHKHIYKQRSAKVIAQESWVVIKGSVKCILYDLDDTIIAEPILKAGDCSVTLYGGHNYVIMEDDTKVLEYKTGPYEGQELDKEFI